MIAGLPEIQSSILGGYWSGYNGNGSRMGEVDCRSKAFRAYERRGSWFFSKGNREGESWRMRMNGKASL